MKALDLFDKIEQVDTPPYLLTRIHQKIANQKKEKMSSAILFTTTLSLVLLIIINVVGIKNFSQNESNDTSLIESLHLSSSNALYE